jgi:hypothetical protein
MPAFELHVRSKSNGGLAAAWFENAQCLWNDERLGTPVPLAGDWTAPTLQLHRPDQGATSVLFNPNAIAVSQGLRDELAAFSDLEFLEVSIAGHGRFFILHVITAIELPPHTSIRLAPAPSGNIVELVSFPDSFTSPSGFFRVLQPVGSAARRVGNTTRALYVGSVGKSAIERTAGQFLEARPK